MYDTILHVAHYLIYFTIYVSDNCPLLVGQFFYVNLHSQKTNYDELHMIDPFLSEF